MDLDKVALSLPTIAVCILAAFSSPVVHADFAVNRSDAANDARRVNSTAAATAGSRWVSACYLVFACSKTTVKDQGPPADAGSPNTTAADRVEKLYNGFAVGTDAVGNEGYSAAQMAEQQLRLDFLSSFQNPQMNAAHQTAWDQEEGQLISDSLKYGGDRTLDAAAMYWGETKLHLPVSNPQDLLAQAESMQVSDQPGEREFDEYMANYLADRFDSLDNLTPHYQTASDDIDGRAAPLDLPDLQAQLRLDEVDRTFGKPKPSGH
jgi:hypothetical protein